MCRAVDVSRSGYYEFKARPKSQNRLNNDKLLIEIRRVFWDNNRNYGSPRIWDQLRNKEHIPCSVNRVFTVTKPNVIWVSDITYIWTLEGWLYLAAILDLFSLGVVGLAMDKNITDTLTQTALTQAILRRNLSKGFVYHSDRGVQYSINDFKNLLARYEFIGSMSKKGDCWDNAVAESFFHTLKVELIHRTKFKTREEAKIKIFEYVEMYYNRKRAHSTLGYLSPFDYEKRSLQSLLTVH